MNCEFSNSTRFLFFSSDADDTPWVKLTTVGNVQRDSQVLAHIENDSCHVMTDYLSRFCLVGQSVNQLGKKNSYKSRTSSRELLAIFCTFFRVSC